MRNDKIDTNDMNIIYYNNIMMMIISCNTYGRKTESDAIITFSVVIWRCCYQQHDNEWCIGWCCWCWRIFITTVTIDPEDTTCCSHCRLNRPTRSKQPMRIAVHIAPVGNAGRSGARDLYICVIYRYTFRRCTADAAARELFARTDIAIRYNVYYT